ncbi:hypothetical protein [Aeromonas intestinalis]
MIETYKDRLDQNWHWGSRGSSMQSAWFALAISWQSTLGGSHD